MWAGSDVCGLLAANVGPFAHNVGLTHGSFAANVGRVEQRLWVSRITFVGRYTYVHQLFNADQCPAYIHTLRWKDRPLQCPRCQSQDIDPWGQYHYRPGCKRYWCNGCKRTFNDLTNTVLHQSQRSVPHWILATFLL